jgi:hypothetical protein
MAWRDKDGLLHIMFLGDGRIEDKKDIDESVLENHE